MTKNEEIDRIKLIRKHKSMTYCQHCGFIYLPMDSIGEQFCPICEEEDRIKYEESLGKPQMDWEYEEELLKLIEEKKAY